jgi:hypothetical protein
MTFLYFARGGKPLEMFEEFRLRISLLRAGSTFLANHSVEYRANSLVASLVVRLRDLRNAAAK